MKLLVYRPSLPNFNVRLIGLSLLVRLRGFLMKSRTSSLFSIKLVLMNDIGLFPTLISKMNISFVFRTCIQVMYWYFTFTVFASRNSCKKLKCKSGFFFIRFWFIYLLIWWLILVHSPLLLHSRMKQARQIWVFMLVCLSVLLLVGFCLVWLIFTKF